jgi:hypothetical protein
LIVQKGTDYAITLLRGSVPRLHAIADAGDSTNNNRWQCVEFNGHFAFYNGRTMRYLGHDGSGNVVAIAKRIDNWELIIPRRHPEGGYQLLSPHWMSALYSINVLDDTDMLARTRHGNTLWEFKVVQ